MSASTPPKPKKLHHVVLHHAKKPHGIIVIGGLLFVASWLVWTFFISPYIAT